MLSVWFNPDQLWLELKRLRTSSETQVGLLCAVLLALILKKSHNYWWAYSKLWHLYKDEFPWLPVISDPNRLRSWICLNLKTPGINILFFLQKSMLWVSFVEQKKNLKWKFLLLTKSRDLLFRVGGITAL